MINKTEANDVQSPDDEQTRRSSHCSSSDRTLILALRALSRDVHCDDGVANACILEASQRIEALSNAIEDIRDSVLNERFQLAEAGLDCDQVNAVLGIIDDNDPRVFD